MKRNLFWFTLITSTVLSLCGCGQSPESEVRKLYRPSSDKDVTTSPEYNFSSFAGTVCKTKVKVAIADLKRYTGAQEIKLLAPERFDPTHPRYAPVADMRIITVLPQGTRLRIERLLQDQGAWGGVQAEAVLMDVTNAQTNVYLDGYLLAGNRWSRGPYSNTNWGINPEMLEKE